MRRPLLLLAVLSIITALSPAIAVSPRDVRIDRLSAALLPPSDSDVFVTDSAWPHWSWTIDSEDGTRNVTQLAYRLLLHLSFRDRRCSCSNLSSTAGQNGGCSVWFDSGRVESGASLHVQHKEAPPLLPGTFYEVAVMYWSSTGTVSEWTNCSFRTALLLANNSQHVNQRTWIGHNDGMFNELRRDFDVAGRVQSAVLYWSGLGYSRPWINGRPVDPSRRLDPGVSDYDAVVLYSSRDVTAMLREAGNAIAVQLGNGWYSQEQYPRGARYPSYGPPRLLLELHIVYSDCELQPLLIRSDLQWTARRGPVLHDSIYHGELFDARLDAITAVSQTNYHDNTSLWLPVNEMAAPTGVLTYQTMPPIRAGSSSLATPPLLSWPSLAQLGRSVRAGGEWPPAMEWRPDDLYTRVFDFSQVMAGYARVCLNGTRGSSVRIVYGEVLQPRYNRSMYNLSLYDGQHGSFVSTDALRSSAGGDVYILRDSSGSHECYEPQHTYHGFRYVQVLGVPDDVDVQVTAVAVHSATELRGSLSFQSDVPDQLQQNVQWALLSNAMSIPTDCPQRDERQGWLGDAALTVDAALYNFDLHAFYGHYLSLIRAVQADDGSIPTTVPFTRGFWPAEATWGSAYVTIAWRVWQHSGDRSVLLDNYDGIRRWLDFLLQQRAERGLGGLDHFFADWLPPGGEMAVNGSLVSAYSLLHDVRLLCSIANVLNESVGAQRYQEAYSDMAAEFHSLFYNPLLHSYGLGEQTANILALDLPNVVPSTVRTEVERSLKQSLEAAGRTTSGVIGISRLFPLLSTMGPHGQHRALSLLLDRSYPGYAFMFSNSVEQATSLWEGWDVPFRGPEMNSRNHHMLASIGAWLYRHVAGIQMDGVDESGRLHIVVRPAWSEDASLLPHVMAHYHTVQGYIMVELNRTAPGSYTLMLDVPGNVVVSLLLDAPQAGAECVRVVEADRMLWEDGQADHESLARAGIWALQVTEPSSGDSSVGMVLGSGLYELHTVWRLQEPTRSGDDESTVVLLVLAVAVPVFMLLVGGVVVVVRRRRHSSIDNAQMKQRARKAGSEPLLTAHNIGSDAPTARGAFSSPPQRDSAS